MHVGGVGREYGFSLCGERMGGQEGDAKATKSNKRGDVEWFHVAIVRVFPLRDMYDDNPLEMLICKSFGGCMEIIFCGMLICISIGECMKIILCGILICTFSVEYNNTCLGGCDTNKLL
jgi:hypothetical protein